MAKTLYAQSSGTQTITSNLWLNMAGLSLTLPSVAPDQEVALIILNVPNPYAKGTDFPGCYFTIRVNGVINPPLTPPIPIACFTSYNQVATNPGRVPTTLVASVRLGPNPINIDAAWQSVRNATAVVDSPCSLTAILTNS